MELLRCGREHEVRIAPVRVIAEVEVRSVVDPQLELTGAFDGNAQGNRLVARLHATAGHFLPVGEDDELAIASDSGRRIEREDGGELLCVSIELVGKRCS